MINKTAELPRKSNIVYGRNGKIYLVEKEKDNERRIKMINNEMYETCKDCPYYYGEINWCMYGEEDVPDNLEKKCEVKNENNN